MMLRVWRQHLVILQVQAKHQVVQIVAESRTAGSARPSPTEETSRRRSTVTENLVIVAEQMRR